MDATSACRVSRLARAGLGPARRSARKDHNGMRALQIYAGPGALRHIRDGGLKLEDIRVMAGAAGGPKGLILSHLDRQLFGSWMAQSSHTVHLVGASVGAWRMATGAMQGTAAFFERLAHDYIHQRYEPEPGRKLPSAELVSREFARELDAFFDGHIESVIGHPRYRLHVVTSRGRHVLGREGRVRRRWATWGRCSAMQRAARPWARGSSGSCSRRTGRGTAGWVDLVRGSQVPPACELTGR